MSKTIGELLYRDSDTFGHTHHISKFQVDETHAPGLYGGQDLLAFGAGPLTIEAAKRPGQVFVIGADDKRVFSFQLSTFCGPWVAGPSVALQMR